MGDCQLTHCMMFLAGAGLTLHPRVVFQVLQFNTNCPECNAPAQTNMKLVRIFGRAVGLTCLEREDYTGWGGVFPSGRARA